MKSPARILIADDDPDLRDIVRCVLESAGFHVVEAADGEAALKTVFEETPELIILDYMMPGLDGPQIIQRVRQDVRLRYIPIIMLTGKSEVHDKVHGINAGADDYMTKPFEPRELLARAEMILKRTSQGLDANPLTRLPGNVTIQRELERRLAENHPIAVCYIDLNRFKAFNDHYGFQRGDQVIKRTAEILLNASKTHGSPTDFVGHIGGDDFLVITTLDYAVPLCEAIVREFDEMAPQLYDEQDRKRGYLQHTDRKGNSVNIPILSVAIALITNEGQVLRHPAQVAELGAELKAYAKRFERSVYVKERRKDS